MSTHREWMYNRLLPGREAYTNEFLSGLEEFMAFACRQPNLSEGKIRCPCKECKNENGASLHTGGSIPHRLHWKRMVILFYYHFYNLDSKINYIKEISLSIIEGGERSKSIIN